MGATSFYEQSEKNKLMSIGLLVLVFAVIAAFAWLIGTTMNPEAAFSMGIIAIIISMLYTIGSYYYCDKLVLASVKAREPNPKVLKEKQFQQAVDNMALAAQLPRPRAYIIDSPEINAFATGRNPKHAVVCVTTGALEKLDKVELDVANYDMQFTTIVAVAVGVAAIMSDIWIRGSLAESGENRGGILVLVGLLLAVLVPIIVRLVQLAISRKREFMADAGGAKLTRYPEGLARALEKIAGLNKPMQVNAAVAPLFFASPLKSDLSDEDPGFIANLFATHPPIKERIKALRSMQGMPAAK